MAFLLNSWPCLWGYCLIASALCSPCLVWQHTCQGSRSYWAPSYQVKQTELAAFWLSFLRLLLISCSPTEPYPSLHNIFWMTYHLNSTPFLYLHHHYCQSQDIIFIRLLYQSPPGLPLKPKMPSLQKLLPWLIWSPTLLMWTTPTLTATLSPLTRWKSDMKLTMDYPLDNPFDSPQR